MKLIRTKKALGNAMHVIQCPKCKSILSSASERKHLPEWSSCDCDEKQTQQ